MMKAFVKWKLEGVWGRGVQPSFSARFNATRRLDDDHCSDLPGFV